MKKTWYIQKVLMGIFCFRDLATMFILNAKKGRGGWRELIFLRKNKKVQFKNDCKDRGVKS